jgi:hypothetical protein
MFMSDALRLIGGIICLGLMLGGFWSFLETVTTNSKSPLDAIVHLVVGLLFGMLTKILIFPTIQQWRRSREAYRRVKSY